MNTDELSEVFLRALAKQIYAQVHGPSAWNKLKLVTQEYYVERLRTAVEHAKNDELEFEMETMQYS